MTPWIRRSLFALLAVATLGALSACASRWHHPGWGPSSDADIARMRERVVGKVDDALGLNTEQHARLERVADALLAQRRALRGEAAQSPRQALEPLVAGERFDRAGALALVEAKTAAIREQAPTLVAALGDFYDGLNPDQQRQVREALARGRPD